MTVEPYSNVSAYEAGAFTPPDRPKDRMGALADKYSFVSRVETYESTEEAQKDTSPEMSGLYTKYLEELDSECYSALFFLPRSQLGVWKEGSNLWVAASSTTYKEHATYCFKPDGDGGVVATTDIKLINPKTDRHETETRIVKSRRAIGVLQLLSLVASRQTTLATPQERQQMFEVAVFPINLPL